MISIGLVVLSLIIFQGIVGMVRGFLKELGVTLVLVATLFGIDRLIPFLEGFVNGGGLQFMGLGPVQDNHTTQVVLAILFTGVLIVATYISYQGETLAYEGQPPKGLIGFALSFLVGAVNGYLNFGTIWWIWNHYNYPFSIVELPLPASAQSIVNGGLLPLDLLAGGTERVDSWGLLAGILILLVILKVLR